MNRIFREKDNFLEFNVYLTPRASKVGIIGLYQYDIDVIGLKIAVHGKPVDNQANIELIKLLSELFCTAKSNIKIKQGLKSRQKVINIEQYTSYQIPSDLKNNISKYLCKMPKTVFNDK